MPPLDIPPVNTQRVVEEETPPSLRSTERLPKSVAFPDVPKVIYSILFYVDALQGKCIVQRH